MTAGWSPAEGCWVYDCIFGCHGTDYESQHDAERALEGHDCQFRSLQGSL